MRSSWVTLRPFAAEVITDSRNRKAHDFGNRPYRPSILAGAVFQHPLLHLLGDSPVSVHDKLDLEMGSHRQALLESRVGLFLFGGHATTSDGSSSLPGSRSKITPRFFKTSSA